MEIVDIESEILIIYWALLGRLSLSEPLGKFWGDDEPIEIA